jgi:hypothetical protein
MGYPSMFAAAISPRIEQTTGWSIPPVGAQYSAVVLASGKVVGRVGG